jgi:hypothetical protein
MPMCDEMTSPLRESAIVPVATSRASVVSCERNSWSAVSGIGPTLDDSNDCGWKVDMPFLACGWDGERSDPDRETDQVVGVVLRLHPERYHATPTREDVSVRGQPGGQEF